MSEQNQSSHRVISVLPTMLIAAIAIIGYVQYQPALKSSRPLSPLDNGIVDPPSPQGLHAINARLWEDPLHVQQTSIPPSSREYPNEEYDVTNIQKHFQSLVRKSEDKMGDSDGPSLLCLPVFLPGGPYADDLEQRLRIRYAVLMGLASQGYHLKYPNKLSYVRIPIVINFGSGGDLKKIPLVVPVKLFRREGTGANPERVLVLWINESRLGDRPLTSLAQVLSNIFGMGNTNTKKIRLAVLGPASSDTLLAMAKETTEWRGPLSAKPNMLNTSDKEMWDTFRDSILNDHFSRFNQDENRLGCPMIFSPRATVDADSLDSELTPWLKSFTPNGIDKDKEGPGIGLIRTIGTDLHLIQALRKELDFRHAWPHKDRGLLQNHKHAIVLLAEQDTLYGRSFCEAFRKELKGYLKKTEQVDDYLQIVHYLRGIDGRRPGKPLEGKSKDNVNNPWETNSSQVLEFPHGASQLDYLQRIQGQVVRLRNRLEGGGIRLSAIGIVGTDLYDKLLILRALRHQFPDVVFFTTDDDARYSHPSEYQFTRNLIIASHFALELEKQLQGKTPPFRDSYQTATYFTVRYLLMDKTLLPRDEKKTILKSALISDLDPWDVMVGANESGKSLNPLIFEVSSDGPYQLTRHKYIGKRKLTKASRLVHPQSPSEYGSIPSGSAIYGSPFFLFVLLLILYLIIAMAKTTLGLNAVKTKQSTRNLLMPSLMAAPLVLALCAAIFTSRHDTQLAGWFKSSTLFVGAPLLLILLARPARNLLPRLGKGAWKVGTVFFLIWVCALILILDHNRQGGEPVEWSSGISLWPVNVIRFAGALLALIFLFRAKENLKKDWTENVERKTEVPLIPKKGKRVKGSRSNKSVADWLKHFISRHLIKHRDQLAKFNSFRFHTWLSEKSQSTQEICEAYRDWSQTKWYRIVPSGLVFLAISFAMFGIEDSYRLPFRGEISRWVSLGVLYAGAFFLLLLIFLVIDAVQLVRGFMKAITENRQIWPEGEQTELKRLERDRNFALNYPQDELLKNPLQDLLTFRIIGLRTNVVGKLVYYPFIVMLFFILARQESFDKLGLPWPLLVMLLIITLGLVISIIAMRITAQHARERILDRLKDDLARSYTAPNSSIAEKQVELVISEVEADNHGAFKPWGQDPLIGALLIPFGGASGLMLIQFFLQRF